MARIIAFDVPREGVTLKDLQPHLKAEAQHAWGLYTAGVFRELYMRTDRPGAVIMLECEGVDEAKKIMAELPLVKADLIEFQYIPVGAFTPWAGLFAAE